MITKQSEASAQHLSEVARAMMTAARTAPKACGIDNLEIVMIQGEEDLRRLSEEMVALGRSKGLEFFLRDAGNVLQAEAVVVIGTRHRVQRLNCAWCGFATCEEKEQRAPLTPCVFNTHDVGLAVGSAVSVAADHRVDNRVMYSAGEAARELGFVEECTIAVAIPIAAMGKNPFFDRKAPQAATCCGDKK